MSLSSTVELFVNATAIAGMKSNNSGIMEMSMNNTGYNFSSHSNSGSIGPYNYEDPPYPDFSQVSLYV